MERMIQLVLMYLVSILLEDVAWQWYWYNVNCSLYTSELTSWQLENAYLHPWYVCQSSEL